MQDRRQNLNSLKLPGYYRFPTLHEDQVVFVSEDDLWVISTEGGFARRLTSNLGEVSRPSYSPDGDQLAFVGQEEGLPEIYLMPGTGGPARRLTFTGAHQCELVGWTPDGRVVFAHNAGQPFRQLLHLYAAGIDGGPLEQLPCGPARAITYEPGGPGVVIGRNTGDPARWKRYRGGSAGQLWIDLDGSWDFVPLIDLAGNLASPMWLGDRIFFLSDHEGIGNLYSCTTAGEDLQRHTDHEGFYARNASSDGRRIVYHCGADLFLFEPAEDRFRPLAFSFNAPRVQRNRRFSPPGRYLESWQLHPAGHAAAITARGKLFTFWLWEGAVRQHGSADGVRYRMGSWLNDGKRLLAVSDESGEETLAIFTRDAERPDILYENLDLGRPEALAINPRHNLVALSNHRYELLVLDLETREITKIDKGKTGPIAGFDWSPGGQWLVYSVSIGSRIMVLKLWNAASKEVFQITDPVLQDVAPAFDPLGNYIYFLSTRQFNPVYDNIHFELSFPRGEKPYLIPLRSTQRSPFIPMPRPPGEKIEARPEEPAGGPPSEEDTPTEDEEVASEKKGDGPDGEETGPPGIRIDLDGIQNRIIAFPVDEGVYGRIRGTRDGQVLYTVYPVNPPPDQREAGGSLVVYDFDKQEEEHQLYGVTDFDLTPDGAVLIVRAGRRLRVLKAGEKPDRGGPPGRQSGWLDLKRIRLSIDPGDEWRQMFREAWRLQRDHFWTQDMSRVDWLSIYDRYLPLVDRVNSRSEFSDLLWEMQGELGTSHCYELGGDYRPKPHYLPGYLGADFRFLDIEEVWEISAFAEGDTWDRGSNSPLNQPGLGIRPGDHLIAINGRHLRRDLPPQALLVHMAGAEVDLALRTPGDEDVRTVTVKALSDPFPPRYRRWVRENRKQVHEGSDGKVGYVHIPDMSSRGYGEFHRSFLAEMDREGLVIDLRYNEGGNVSSLILEKLARRRIGYDVARWAEIPEPYPPESPPGPMVALTNEYAGSDGDVFSHGFKILGLGPLIGKRTWGGVVGIWPRHALVDGTVTTQPEISLWFEDVGWGVENYGTEPNIEVEITPQEYARGEDPQLARAIEEILEQLDRDPQPLPDFDPRPDRTIPKLPPR